MNDLRYGLRQLLRCKGTSLLAFLPDDRAKETGNLVLLSHELWQQHFGGAADLIGNTIKLDGTAYTVVGIMPPNHWWQFEPRPSDQCGPNTR